MRYVFALLSILVIGSFTSCKQKTAQTSDVSAEADIAKTIKAADFNADTAYYFVNEQVKFGPRVPNSKSHVKCAGWLEATLNKYTPNIFVQQFTAKAFDGTVLNCRNIIASFNPKSTARVLLCSHWDSRPFADNDPDSAYHRTPIDGANDGASGVGILLEIARQLKISPAAIGVDILLLDGEDYGAPQNAGYTGTDDWALGSQYWSRYPHVPSYSARYGILLDMVGAENAVFTLEGTSMYYAPDFAQRVWNMGASIGYSDYFSTERTNAITDDHVYINQLRQVPTIDIIQHDQLTQSGFYQNWHTIKDNMKGISKPTLMAVGQTILTVVRDEK
ncbi:MAG: M28 family peptidase [Bacteroidales bacterium]|nr:M28 family peptidase [Bacteroidales bacterium]